ncbi:MAG: hypothetical protein IT307_19550 [Chloroflexi bacterium]|nr:hypothetical protein [Chloroflexota bacterium]
MQLHEYWNIVRRRLWLVALCGLGAMLVSAFLALRGPNAWCSKLQLSVSLVPEPVSAAGIGPSGDRYRYDTYYAWVASEYLADDLSEVLRSEAFARDVAAEVGHSIDPGLIVSATRTKKTHREIDIAICGADRNAIGEIGEAYERTLNTKMKDYFAQLQAQNGAVRVINSATVTRGTSAGGVVGDVLLRTLVGLSLGIALAFLLDFLDRTIRDRQDAERLLELPVLGEVPRSRRLAAR